MIVNLTIDGEHLLLVGREQRLTTALRIYNTKTLMRQYCCPADLYTTPVRSAVTDFLTHPQGFLPELRCLFLNVQD